MTIIQAALTVLRESKTPLSASEVLAAIQKRGLYSFAAKDPLNVVRAQLRRHSEGYEHRGAAMKALVRRAGKDAYEPIGP